MRILSVGPFSANNFNNTSVHRSKVLQSLATDFYEFDSTIHFDFYTRCIYKLISNGIQLYLPDQNSINKNLIDFVAQKEVDLIWIDKGTIFTKKTLEQIKKLQPNAKLVHYMIDDFMNPYHRTKQILETIPVYDYYIVNRKANIDELKQRGCKKPIFTFMSYESSYHYPREIIEQEKLSLGGGVGFIGTFEKERAESICYLADQGIPVRVYGNGWKHLENYSSNLMIEGKGLYSDNFCKAIQAFKINLGFLRKKSRDLHTTRSTEIPACGGFMLAERTSEHLALFEEGKEAVFFTSNQELYEQCLYYLNHEDERLKISQAGYQKCLDAGYDNQKTIKRVLDEILNDVKL